MDIQMNTRRILIFLAFAFGVPWAAALVLYLTLGTTDLLKAGAVANIIFVTTPAIANVVTRLITREGWGSLWLWPKFKRGWRFYLAAWLLPFLSVSVGAAIFYLFFPQSFDANFSKVQKLYASLSSVGTTAPWMLMLFLTLQVLIITVPINAVLSIGEEFGWRAYLLPKLIERFTGGEPDSSRSIHATGARKAAVLIGLIWGVWHWPLFLMTLSLTPDLPLSYLLVYPVSTICMSVLLCWVTLRSRSVWPASVGHGAINAFAGVAGYTLKGPANMLLGPAGGLIGGIGYLALALILLVSRKAFADEKVAFSENMPAAARA